MAIIDRVVNKIQPKRFQYHVDGFFLVESEEIKRVTTVGVWNFTNLWPVFLVLIFMALFYDYLFGGFLPILATILLGLTCIFYMRYFVRQYWRICALFLPIQQRYFGVHWQWC